MWGLWRPDPCTLSRLHCPMHTLLAMGITLQAFFWTTLQAKLLGLITGMSSILWLRINAKYRKRIGSGDLFVKNSEYSKQFQGKNSSKVPGTDYNIYNKPSELKRDWQKSNLPTENTTYYQRHFVGAQVPENKLVNDKEIRSGFKDRNGNIIGNKYASTEGISHANRTFAYPEKQIGVKGKGETILKNKDSSQIGSERSLKNGAQYLYKSHLDGKTTYNKTFVDHHIKHCHCL